MIFLLKFTYSESSLGPTEVLAGHIERSNPFVLILSLLDFAAHAEVALPAILVEEDALDVSSLLVVGEGHVLDAIPVTMADLALGHGLLSRATNVAVPDAFVFALKAQLGALGLSGKVEFPVDVVVDAFGVFGVVAKTCY